MTTLSRIQPSKRKPGGPALVLRHRGRAIQFRNERKGRLAYIDALASDLDSDRPDPGLDVVSDQLVRELATELDISTIRSHMASVRSIRRLIGDVPVQAISLTVAEGLRDGLIAEGRSRSQVSAVVNLLCRITRFAFEQGYVASDRCAAMSLYPLPAVSQARSVRTRRNLIMPGSADIRHMLLNGAGKMGLFTHFGLLGATRAGEALGADWDAVDWSNMEFDIRQSWNGRRESEVKTLASNRLIPIVDQLAARLREAHIRAGYPRRGPIFMTDDGGRLGYPALRHAFYRWQNGIGFGSFSLIDMGSYVRPDYGAVWPPHALRHAAAALMITSGMPLEDVQAWLGHVDPAMTLGTYAYLFQLRSAGITEFASTTSEDCP